MPFSADIDAMAHRYPVYTCRESTKRLLFFGLHTLFIKDNLENIDNTLWLILDPKQRDIDVKELKSKFNYPYVDLDKIDLDWRIENY